VAEQCSLIGQRFLRRLEKAAEDASVFDEKNLCREVDQTAAMAGVAET
jgi:hypothetical protein